MFEGKEWYEYLDEPMQKLMSLGFFLLEREEVAGETLEDYSFIVFPVAKAYEGFLKKVLYELNLISKDHLMGKSFRIGKSLNPDLPEKLKGNDWVYGRMEAWCHEDGSLGEDVPRKMWETWRLCRNRVFHYFMGEEQLIGLGEAKERVEMVSRLMEEVVACLKNHQPEKKK